MSEVPTIRRWVAMVPVWTDEIMLDDIRDTTVESWRDQVAAAGARPFGDPTVERVDPNPMGDFGLTESGERLFCGAAWVARVAGKVVLRP